MNIPQPNREKNSRKRYDWKSIQSFYDRGYSWADVINEYGMTNQALAKAVKRGDFTTRSAKETRSIKYKNGLLPPVTLSAEARTKISKALSGNNHGGKCKWYTVNGKKVQGTWERDLAIFFESYNIKWETCRSKPWPYVMDGNLRHYTPDFYLPEFDVYLDPKGYWWGNDKEKFVHIKEQHSDKKLLIVEKDLFNEILNSDGNLANVVNALD